MKPAASSLRAQGKRQAFPLSEAIQLWRSKEPGWLRREERLAMTGLRLQVFQDRERSGARLD
jgi:hypothetical protein